MLQDKLIKMIIWTVMLFTISLVHGCASDGGSPRFTGGTQRATALCKDGSLSYSPNCLGTCSDNGGVDVWYANCGQ